ncbi:MAG: hypothetical protein GSR80_000055 [Desulfurococcales archaeon]|nr:hypothetical protein [Desulfurococcales archaeon]
MRCGRVILYLWAFTLVYWLLPLYVALVRRDAYLLAVSATALAVVLLLPISARYARELGRPERRGGEG